MAPLVSTSQGTSWGFGARGMAGITAFDTLELGWQHFTNELQTVSAIGLATLPSDDITVGYHRLMPLSYAFSLVYDYRGHAACRPSTGSTAAWPSISPTGCAGSAAIARPSAPPSTMAA